MEKNLLLSDSASLLTQIDDLHTPVACLSSHVALASAFWTAIDFAMNHAHQRQQPARPTDATLFGWRKRNDRTLKPNTSRTPTHFLFVVRPGTCSLSWKWRSPDRRRTHKQDPLSLCSWHFFTSLASHHSCGRNQSLSHPVLGSWKTICRTQVTWVKVVAKRKKKLRNIGKPSGNHAFM